jgi:GRASP55/65 PDZ-like domain
LNKKISLVVFNIKSQKERLVYLTPSDSWGGAGLLGVTIRLDDYAMAEERIIRVLSVDQPHSPAAVAGLVPERDYILGTTQVSLDQTDTLAALLRQHQDQVLELYVYNADSDLVRTVALMPTLSWGGRGLLGADVGMGYLHRLPSSVRATDGASVERKVRYVAASSQRNNNKMLTPEAPVMTGLVVTNQQPNAAAGGTTTTGEDHGGSSAMTSSKQQPHQQQGIFEHEPQLEMEPPDHEEEEDEDAPPQVSPVASAEAKDGASSSKTEAQATSAATMTSTTVTEALLPPPPPRRAAAAAAAAAASAASAAAAVFSEYHWLSASTILATGSSPNVVIAQASWRSYPCR